MGTMSFPRGPITHADLARQYTRTQIATHYRPLWRGMYVRADVRHTLAIRTAAVAVAYPEAILTGWSAAQFLRHPWVPRDAPAAAASPVSRRALPGREFTRLLPDQRHVISRRGMRLTDPVATAADLCRRLSWAEAVVALDGMELAHPGTAARLRRVVDRFPQPRVIERVLDHVVGGIMSQEVARLRVTLLEAGIGGLRAGRPLGTHPHRVCPLLADPTTRRAVVVAGSPPLPGWEVATVPLHYATLPPRRLVALVAAAFPENPDAGGQRPGGDGPIGAGPAGRSEAGRHPVGDDDRLWAA